MKLKAVTKSGVQVSNKLQYKINHLTDTDSKITRSVNGSKMFQFTPVSSVYLGFSPVLHLGVALGLCPFQMTTSTSTNILRAYCFYNLVANWVVVVFAVIIFFRDLGANNLVEQFLDLVFHSHILITITCILRQTPKLPHLMKEWAAVDLVIRSFEKPNENHVVPTRRVFQVLNVRGRMKQRDTKPRALVVSYVIVAVVGGVSYFTTVWLKDSFPSWEHYLIHVAEIYVIQELAFPIVGIYILYLGLVQELLWAFGDIYLLSVTLTLFRQYQRFNKIVRSTLDRQMSPQDLDHLRVLQRTLTRITKETVRMLSTLTFTVVVCDVLYLFSRVYNGLEEDLKHPHPFVPFEAVYAFSYLIIRIFATVICAAKLAAEAQMSLPLIRRSLNESSSLLLFLVKERLIVQLESSHIGLSGEGYFNVDGSFVATLVSALLTYEVVILQFSVTAHQQSSSNGDMNLTLST